MGGMLNTDNCIVLRCKEEITTIIKAVSWYLRRKVHIKDGYFPW